MPSQNHVVPVPLDDRTAERENAGERLRRLRADGDVAEADEAVELLALELGEDGLEGEQVAVESEMTPMRFTSRAPGRDWRLR